METCEDCGVTSEEVYDVFCPFAMEIYDEEIPVTLCPDCYQERAYEV